MVNGLKGDLQHAWWNTKSMARHVEVTWSSTASSPYSSRLDHVLPLDQVGPGRESEVDAAQLSFT